MATVPGHTQGLQIRDRVMATCRAFHPDLPSPLVGARDVDGAAQNIFRRKRACDCSVIDCALYAEILTFISTLDDWIDGNPLHTRPRSAASRNIHNQITTAT